MKIGMIFRSLVFTLLAAVVCYPQVKKYGEAPSTPLLARISYQSSFVAGSGQETHHTFALHFTRMDFTGYRKLGRIKATFYLRQSCKEH
ncbi:MAG TPA: hypothetical protein VFA90_13605 [Terriglobales bacterium]|nr:hypothetical protein [Terriglobales bacterium]